MVTCENCPGRRINDDDEDPMDSGWSHHREAGWYCPDCTDKAEAFGRACRATYTAPCRREDMPGRERMLDPWADPRGGL